MNPSSASNMRASGKGDQEKQMAPAPTHGSIHHGEVTVNDDNIGDLHRSFSPRQIHIISLGSSMGSGIFIATGKALASGGPGTMFLAYLIVCSGVWANLQILGEMTIAFPVSGSFVDYAGRWVDPALAFGAGFAEWLGWIAVFAAEAEFFVVLIRYWGDAVPHAALITIFLALCLIVFCLPNKVFAWLQCFGSLVKIILFVFVAALSLALIAGAGPTGVVRDGSYWRDGQAFQNGFGGFASCALLAIWAVGDQVFISVMGGEASSPRYSMAHASTLIPLRVGFMYLAVVVLIGIIVPSDDPLLLGESGSAASPFVIAANNAGLAGIPDFINVCMIIGIMAISLEALYLPSRIIRTMALQGLIPEVFAKCDQKGRPRWALLISSTVGVALSYLSLSSGGTMALNWFISITSASFFTNWAIIAFTSLRFRAALRVQDDKLFNQTFAWKSKLWPLPAVHLLVVSTMLLVCLFTTADHSNPDNSAELDPRSIDPDSYVEEASGTLESPHTALPYYVHPSDQTYANQPALHHTEDGQAAMSQIPPQSEMVYRTRPVYGSPNSGYYQYHASQVNHANGPYSHNGFYTPSPRMKNALDHIGAWDDNPQASDYPASPEPERGRKERRRLKFSNLPGRSKKTESTERERSTSRNVEKRNRRKR
ncbi:general amino-acid permease gap1 [Colletotrichum karsti]|uniref:General amino-acid permease gap1 n=1 Tax=Colletotrichum karsti TaxID=1095194 RepID=A0A9P6I132_9PEZI|nr:general amino-acid permease gap1 [Colletotrichum karsti]KAF9875022.1 general amino-acid permease gap1 [Colletotrichum karsti]